VSKSGEILLVLSVGWTKIPHVCGSGSGFGVDDCSESHSIADSALKNFSKALFAVSDGRWGIMLIWNGKLNSLTGGVCTGEFRSEMTQP
jgi:hypothetical protein